MIALAYLGYKANNNLFFYLLSLGYLLYLIIFRKKLNFAANIISHSAKGLQSNPQLVPALLGIKVLYVLQAMLFINFFAKGLEIRDVEEVTRPKSTGEVFCTAGSQYDCEYYQYDT